MSPFDHVSKGKKILESIPSRILKRYYRITTFLRTPIGRILYFHRITEPNTPQIGPWKYAISPKSLRKFLRQISQERNIVSLGELIRKFKNQEGINQKLTALTFDDGYRDFYTNALPILKELQIPATVFVTSSFVDNERIPYEFPLYNMICHHDQLTLDLNGKSMSFKLSNCNQQKRAFKDISDQLKTQSYDKKTKVLQSALDSDEVFEEYQRSIMLSEKQLDEISNDSLVTIGLHGRNHRPAQTLRPTRWEHQLQKAKSNLKTYAQKPIKYYAYPYGTIPSISERILRDCGFQFGFTTREEDLFRWHHHFFYEIPRIEGSQIVKRSLITYYSNAKKNEFRGS